MPHITAPVTCDRDCPNDGPAQSTKMIVLTGGPGAGKTAVLEIIRKELCEHVAIMPEAASIIFGGGFWRLDSASARLCSQRAILHVQQQMENLILGENKWPVVLCDRGLLDGLAYWSAPEADFWAEARSTLAAQFARYHAVIHLQVPGPGQGYNHRNPLRTETAAQAANIDDRIRTIWSAHPRYHSVESSNDFLKKARSALGLITQYLPKDCVRA